MGDLFFQLGEQFRVLVDQLEVGLELLDGEGRVFCSTCTKLFRIFFSFARRADSWGLFQMAGSLSLASISFIFSVFSDISKKPPEVGGFLFQFGEQIFELNEFHGAIVAGFDASVKLMKMM